MCMNKLVLITGAGRGIGLEIATILAQKGYDLALITKSSESADVLRQNNTFMQGKTSIWQVDVADKQNIQSFIQSWNQPLWGIVNNAGVVQTMTLMQTGIDPWEQILHTNLDAPYLLVKGLLPYITHPGRIVNISSQLGKEGRAGYSAYCASKFGLIGMTKCWAKELGQVGVTVNAVCPGWVETEMSGQDIQRMAQEHQMTPEEYYHAICQPLELKRFNSTEEVAHLVAFLLSEEASGITGRDWLMQTIWNEE